MNAAKTTKIQIGSPVRIRLSNGYKATGVVVRQFKNGNYGVREKNGRYRVRFPDQVFAQ